MCNSKDYENNLLREKITVALLAYIPDLTKYDNLLIKLYIYIYTELMKLNFIKFYMKYRIPKTGNPRINIIYSNNVSMHCSCRIYLSDEVADMSNNRINL